MNVCDLDALSDEELKELLWIQPKPNNMGIISQMITPMTRRKMTQGNMVKHIIKHKDELSGVQIYFENWHKSKKPKTLSVHNSDGPTETKTISTTETTTTTTTTKITTHTTINDKKQMDVEESQDIDIEINDKKHDPVCHYFDDLVAAAKIKNNNNNNNDNNNVDDISFRIDNNDNNDVKQNTDNNDDDDNILQWQIDSEEPQNKWLILTDNNTKILRAEFPADGNVDSEALIRSTLIKTPFCVITLDQSMRYLLGRDRVHHVNYFPPDEDEPLSTSIVDKQYLIHHIPFKNYQKPNRIGIAFCDCTQMKSEDIVQLLNAVGDNNIIKLINIGCLGNEWRKDLEVDSKKYQFTSEYVSKEAGIVTLTRGITTTGVRYGLFSGRFRSSGRFKFEEFSEFGLLTVALPKVVNDEYHDVKYQMIQELCEYTKFLNECYEMVIVLCHMNGIFLNEYCTDAATVQGCKWEALLLRHWLVASELMDYGFVQTPRNFEPSHFANDKNKKDGIGQRMLFALTKRPRNYFLDSMSFPDFDFLIDKPLVLKLKNMQEFFDQKP